jgi:ferric-dicitrate binding protein FerR (iron transport regulator)
VVTLNSGATLSYPSGFTGSFRKVTLQGEAWFEVAHDKTKPFIVAAENIRIRVVGTSFSVNTKTVENTKEVILSSGIVKVYDETHPEKTTLLLPGEKAEITETDNAIQKTRNDDINFLAWKTQHLVFNSTPLNEVAALLTKVYRTNIRLSDERLSKCTITATFDKQSLESVLNVLKATLDLQIRSNGAGFDLSGRGCDQNR